MPPPSRCWLSGGPPGRSTRGPSCRPRARWMAASGSRRIVSIRKPREAAEALGCARAADGNHPQRNPRLLQVAGHGCQLLGVLCGIEVSELWHEDHYDLLRSAPGSRTGLRRCWSLQGPRPGRGGNPATSNGHGAEGPVSESLLSRPPHRTQGQTDGHILCHGQYPTCACVELLVEGRPARYHSAARPRTSRLHHQTR